MGSYQPDAGQPADMLPDDVRSRVEFEVNPEAAAAALAERLQRDASAPVEKPAEPITQPEDDSAKE